MRVGNIIGLVTIGKGGTVVRGGWRVFRVFEMPVTGEVRCVKVGDWVMSRKLMESGKRCRRRSSTEQAMHVCQLVFVTIFFSSSSFCWASVANAPNVLRPYWHIVLPLDVPDLTASLLLWGPSGEMWRCLWTFLISSVPTFVTSRLQEILAAKGGTTWARNGR